MENVKVSCADARVLDLVEYLNKLGITQTKIRGNDFWYFSPFRTERTPSFKVNRQRNRWYDFGEGCGGSMIDFAIRYQGCTVVPFLLSLNDHDFSFHRPPYSQSVNEQDTDNRIAVLSDYTLSSYQLIQYLTQRRIPINIVNSYCREVRYSNGGKTYYAIGFQNQSGGWELRNPYFKGSPSPKDYTLINPGCPTLFVFEGFMDFLSLLIMMPEAENTYSFLVLNSLSFFEKARPEMEAYQQIWLFLDNDTPGQNCSLYASSLSPIYKDKSSLYKNYKDLNEWLCHPGIPDVDVSKLIEPSSKICCLPIKTTIAKE